jgi:hypothetical protein
LITTVYFLVSGVLGLLVAVGLGYFTAKALKVKGIGAVIGQANDTLTLYDSRIRILEDNLKDMQGKYEEMVIRNKYLEELLLQKADLKLVHTKLNRLLKAGGHDFEPLHQ